MNVKKIVLLSLIFYALSAVGILGASLFFGDPAPGVDPAQSLLNLNNAAQNGIANRTNEQVNEVALTDPKSDTPDTVIVPTQTDTAPSTSTSNSSTTASSTAPSTPITPAAPAPGCGQGGTCTVAEVATHNTRSDCWVRYNSKAYNVTSYVRSHPGGSGSFDGSTCGTDITAQMQGSAGSASSPKTNNHSSSAYNMLNPYFVANVSG